MKRNWTKEEIKAIKLSLEHWYENLMMLQLNKLSNNDPIYGVYKSASFCALCDLYLETDECECCPLFTIGQYCGGYDSAWYKASYAINNLDFKNKIKETCNMINVLESLLD